MRFWRRRKRPLCLIDETGPEMTTQARAGKALNEFRISVKAADERSQEQIVQVLRRYAREHGMSAFADAPPSGEPIEQDTAPTSVEIKTPDGRIRRYYRMDVVFKYLQRRLDER